MKNNNKAKERRASERHPVSNSSAVVLNPNAVISFEVLDICAGGLSFSYNPTGSKALSGQAIMDYLGEEKVFTDIPIEIASDTQISETQPQEGIPHLRRCGVKFSKPMPPDTLNKLLNKE